MEVEEHEITPKPPQYTDGVCAQYCEEERHLYPHAHWSCTDFVGFETHFWVCVFYHCSERLGDIMTADVLLIVIVVEPFQLVAAARSMSL